MLFEKYHIQFKSSFLVLYTYGNQKRIFFNTTDNDQINLKFAQKTKIPSNLVLQLIEVWKAG